MRFHDWMNWGGTDDNHNSGISLRIRDDGPYKTITSRAQLTRGILGRGHELGIWLPRGTDHALVRRNGGQIPGWPMSKVNGLRNSWDDELICAINEVRRTEGVEVLPYLGGLDWMSESEFRELGRVIEGSKIKRVVIDTLAMNDSAVEAVRVQLLRDRYGVEEVGAEYPQKFPSNADFGFALDQINDPDTGRERGASNALTRGHIPNGQSIGIIHGWGWPDTQSRIKKWAEMPGVQDYYANLANDKTRAAIVEAMRLQDGK